LASLNPSNSPFSPLTGPLLLTGRLSALAGLEIFKLLAKGHLTELGRCTGVATLDERRQPW